MYEKNNTLARYFSIPKYATVRSAIFGTMKYLGVIRQKTDEQLSNGDGFVYFRQFDESKYEETSSNGRKFDDKVEITVESVPKESWTAKTIVPNVEQEMKEEDKKHSLYWSPNMGKWGCNDCNQKGDKFDMQGFCKGK
jgi:hypothetical protein